MKDHDARFLEEWTLQNKLFQIGRKHDIPEIRALNKVLSEGLEECKPGEASTRNGGCVSPQ